MTDLTIPLPASASADGKKNGYVFACETIGQRRIYPICLNLIAKKDDKHLEVLYPDCISSIKKGSCPALKMKREEENAGSAIYYLDRSIDIVIPPYKPARVKHVEVSTVNTDNSNKGVLDRLEDVTYEAVLNSAIEKEKPKVVPIKTEPVAGESLLDMARRMLAAKNSNKEVSH